MTAVTFTKKFRRKSRSVRQKTRSRHGTEKDFSFQFPRKTAWCSFGIVPQHVAFPVEAQRADDGQRWLAFLFSAMVSTVAQETAYTEEEKNMIILITGASHTGKTVLAQQLLEKYKFPYLSVDHLKMGLIRSGYTHLTPNDDDLLTEYLWPVLREIIKTAIENRQNLIIEGCYIPFSWQQDFEKEYLEHIKFYCIIMSDNYIKNNFNSIKKYENVIERRSNDETCTIDNILEDNARFLSLAEKHHVNYVLIDEQYAINIDLK